MAVTLSAFGGLKLNDKIAYDGQVRKFGAARSSFNKVLPSLHNTEGYRVPRWEDDRVWKELYNRDNGGKKISIGNGDTETIKFLGSPRELRDICYKMILKEATNKYEGCNASSGWCEACLIGKGWYGTPDDY